MKKTRPRHSPKHNTHRLLCNARIGSLLTYQAIRPGLREMDIAEREIRTTDIWDRVIGETVDTGRFNQQLLIHILIRGFSGRLGFSQRLPRRARMLWRHKPQLPQPTEVMSLSSSLLWVRRWSLWPWGRPWSCWLWGMLLHLLLLLRNHDWLIIYHGIYIVSRCIYKLFLANRPRFIAIILILILLLRLLIIFLLLIFLMFIVTVPFHILITV